MPKKVNAKISPKLSSNKIKSNNSVYVVKSGDTLSQIAERFGVKTNDLRSFNNIDGNNIRVGQNLSIPYITVDPVVADIKPIQPKLVKTPNKNPTLPVKTSKEISNTNSTNKSTYIVKRGDTVSQIAEKFGISTSDLKLYNDLENNNIRVGQSLKLPYITRTAKNEVAAKPKVSSKKPALTITKKKPTEKIAVKIEKPKPKYTVEYTVKGDDTLNKIAEKFNKTTKELRSENKLSNNIIYVGQKLRISSDKPIVLAEKPKKIIPKTISKKTEIYVVRKGDTLHSISRKFVTDVKTLKEFNGLTSNNLKIGRVLRVPSSSLTYSESGKLVYKVSNGDSLGTIADNFGISIASIKSANNLSSNNISAGSKLIIPSKPKSSASKSKKSSDKTVVKYKVKKGDTLASIARNHNTSIDSIKESNGLSGHAILRGQTLSVPSSIQKSRKTSKKRKKVVKNDTNNIEKLIKVAKKYLGAPYKFGGTSTKTGIDCSAYVNKVFRSVDVNLPRTARAIYKKGNPVSKKHLNKGDLVFFRTYAKFPSHVGIYLGNGKFIHASSAKKKVTITDLNKRYYQKRYIGAKRIPIKSIRYSKKFNKDQKL